MLVLPITIAAIVLVVFVAPVLLAQRHSARAQETFVSSGVVVPKVIQNSTIVYGIGLATVAPLFAWGVGGEFWPAIVYVGFVGLGLFLIYVLRRPWLEFLAGALGQDSSVTVHEFIARRHGNDPRLSAVAAALTVFAIAGFLVCTMLGMAVVLKPLLSDNAGLAELFIAATFVVVVARPFRRAHRDDARGSTSDGPAVFWTVRSDRVFVVSSGFGPRGDAGARHRCDRCHTHRGRGDLFPQARPIRRHRSDPIRCGRFRRRRSR